MAAVQSVKILWDDPADAPDVGKGVYDSMFAINETTYHRRGGKLPHLSNRQTVATQGRADARLAIDHAGELYIYSKSDGMIRQIVAATATQ
jgi:hypothetical protein